MDSPPPGTRGESGARAEVFGWRGAGLFIAYLLASLWMWRHVVPHLATRTLGSGLLDPGLFIWWLKWIPYALTHGMSPLHSTYLDAPSGVSAMWNTSVVAPGIVFAPVTMAFGPVVTFNLLCILGPPLSAWTAWLWLRRHAGSVPAALGGLVFGFSPFVNAESRAGHLSLTWLFLLPVILILVEDLLWRSERPRWPQAPLLGIAVAAQFLTGSEALLILTLGCVGMSVLLAVSNPRAARDRLRVLLPGAAVAAGVALALCAWPLVEEFGGGRRITQPVQLLGTSGGRLAMLVGAPTTLAFHTGSGPIGPTYPVENGLYVGWPLIALLATTAVVLWRRRGVLIAAIAVIVAADFQLYGTRWHFAGLSVPAPLSFLQEHVAITRDILPGRFAIVMWLAIAWLVTVGLDAALTRLRAGRLDRRWALVPMLVTAACLVPLLPAPETPTNPLAATPRFFTTSLRNIIPNGATVMVAPMATVRDDVAQLWQVEAGMRFRQVGGFMLHAVAGGAPSYYPATPTLTNLFDLDAAGLPFLGVASEAMLESARAELRAAGVSVFVVGPSRYGTRALIARAERLLGRPPERKVGGVSLWLLRDRTT